jgi:2-dehydropantoate 2-reductase
LPSDVDAVLLSVKSYDTEETLDRLLPMLPAGVPVVSLQNGLNEVAIAEAVGADRTVGAVVMFDGVLVAPGHVRTRRPEAPLTIGAWGSADVSRLAATLGQAVPTVVSDDIRADLWGKLVVNCMLNAPAAAAGLGLRDLVHADAGPTACAEVAREAVTVASRCGIAVPPESLYGVDPIAHPEEFAQTVVRTFADSELRPSMLTDVERGRRTEIDALNGVVVAEGRRLGVDTPWNTHFREVVTRIEHGAAQPDERWLRP